MVEFMEKISVRNVEELTIDDRNDLSVACDKVNGAHQEMSAVILSTSSSPAIDISLIVKDYRSKVEKELNDICNKVSNLSIKLDIKDYVESFQATDLFIIIKMCEQNKHQLNSTSFASRSLHASTADDISEDDFFVDWDPECLENGVGNIHVFLTFDSLYLQHH
nr:14-3-3-like protein A [Tanacetum cinerariifolium]